MIHSIFLCFLINIIIVSSAFAQQGKPEQPEHGPGGWGDYKHESIEIIGEFAEKADGYWMYLPALPVPDSADVVIFIHGFGAHNPVAYGAWIRHLVNRGNIVIFPRFQKTYHQTAFGKCSLYRAFLRGENCCLFCRKICRSWIAQTQSTLFGTACFYTV